MCILWKKWLSKKQKNLLLSFFWAKERFPIKRCVFETGNKGVWKESANNILDSVNQEGFIWRFICFDQFDLEYQKEMYYFGTKTRQKILQGL